MPNEIKQMQAEAAAQGFSLVYVAVDEQFGGAIELVPVIRPEAKAIIRQLRQRNMDLYIISGDHEQPTRRLAHELGIEHYFAETLPENKADLVAQLREEGKFVCFIGDGINDAIALKKANVSISMRGASSAATDTAQIILMDGTLNHLNQLFEIADDFEENMRLNVISSVLSGAVCIGGVFLLHFGLWAGMAVCYAGIAGGLANTMSPLVKYQKQIETRETVSDRPLPA